MPARVVPLAAAAWVSPPRHDQVRVDFAARHRELRLGRVQLCACRGEVSPRRSQARVEVARVELEQHRTRFHALVVTHQHARNLARDARSHVGHVPFDLRVVGALLTAAERDGDRGSARGDERERGENDERPAARLGGAGRLGSLQRFGLLFNRQGGHGQATKQERCHSDKSLFLFNS
jgi:hypothetical protein